MKADCTLEICMSSSMLEVAEVKNSLVDHLSRNNGGPFLSQNGGIKVGIKHRWLLAE